MQTIECEASFVESLRDCYRDEQIIISGSDYDLLAKDPAVNSRKPHAFVFPETNEQIQYLVKMAAACGVKLWVYSTGKNWGYLNTCSGDSAIVVNLNRMNRIILVDEELAYAVIEPGVTYEMLNRHLEANNYKLWTDSPGGPPSGSVIGNALDRGVGVTKYGDHFAHLCGLEVVLADGSILRTGTARSDGAKGAAHLYKWGVGPYIEGLFSQSNFGVVTQAGIWLMRKPRDYRIFNLPIKDDVSLGRCMDAVRELMLNGVVPDIGRFSNDVAMLTLVTQATQEGFQPKESISRDELDTLKKKFCLPTWTGSFAIYGEPNIVAAAEKCVKRELRRSGSCLRIHSFSKRKTGWMRSAISRISRCKSNVLIRVLDAAARCFFGTSLEVVKLFPGLVDLHEGKPVETVVRRGYFRYKQKRPDSNIHAGRDDIGILWSVPVCPFKGDEVVQFASKCRKFFDEHSFDFYMTIMVFNARSVCPLMVILYDRLDPDECARAEKLYNKLLDLSHRMGYQHFRAGINGWKKLFRYCSAIKQLNQKLKLALDPSGVFAPGRYGID